MRQLLFPIGNFSSCIPKCGVFYSRSGIKPLTGLFSSINIPYREYIFRRNSVKILVKSVTDIGAAVRSKRKGDGLTLVDAAGLCNVNYRFLSNLENGKPTVRLDKVLQVLAALGLELEIKERMWSNE